MLFFVVVIGVCWRLSLENFGSVAKRLTRAQRKYPAHSNSTTLRLAIEFLYLFKSQNFRKFHVFVFRNVQKNYFNSHLRDHALRGHVFKAVFVEDEELCRLNRYLENNCISYNFVKNKTFCELSDSDHRQHPEDLQPMNGFLYGAGKVKCISTDLLCSLLFKGA